MSLQTVLFISIVLLILAKVLSVVHVSLSDTLYLDIDRLIALVGFLTVYHRWSQIPLSYKPYGILVTSALIVSLLAVMLGIAFEKMLVLFLMTAFVEEILLRGVLFELLLQKLSPTVTLFSTSLFFTLVHPAIYQNALYGLAVLITGMLLGAIYLFFRKQGREIAIVYATILHGLIILLGLSIGLI